MRENADEAVLRERAGCPPVRVVVGKPVVGELVMHVIGIEQGDEQVHIEQCDAIHSSSLSSLTSFIVTIRPGR